MPELPEVETMRRGVLPVVGARVVETEFPRSKRLKSIEISPRPGTFRSRVIGQHIVGARRFGKRVVIDLGPQQSQPLQSIVFEPRMTGLVLISDPPNEEHLRVRLRLSSKSHPELLFWDRRGLGNARLYPADELEEHLSHSLGPDALTIEVDELRDRLRKSVRQIKVALLDQKVVAGVGNLYASELLFMARVHPGKRCSRLTKAEWQRVHEAMIAVLTEAIKYEGSTLGDGTYRNALNNPGSCQNHHRVYDRAGSECPGCGANIVRIVQAQRSTFYCKRCQRK